MSKPVKRSIFVTTQIEGIHKYPEALTDPKLKTGDWDDVSFLGYPHRHMFGIKVEVDVTHDNRDIEFIQLKRYIDRLYGNGTISLDYKSCEMMADDLHAELIKYVGNRPMTISIDEDGENGAISKYE